MLTYQEKILILLEGFIIYEDTCENYNIKDGEELSGLKWLQVFYIIYEAVQFQV